MADIYRTISEQVADQLRTRIFNREFEENAVLREQELSDVYQVSRGTIRHVLLTLAKEGLLTSIPNIGMQIAPYPSERGLDIIVELRSSLESKILDYTWDILRDNELDAWKEILSKMEAAVKINDAKKYRLEDISFHRFFVNLYPDKHIIELWGHLLSRMRMSHLDTSKLAMSINDHRKIVYYVENNEKDKAIELLAKNIVCI